MKASSEEIEIKLLVDGIYMKYGYDFRDYAQASLRRRLSVVISKFNCHDIMNFLKRVLENSSFFQQVLPHLTVGTTEMFRDPEFFFSLRQKIVPILRTFPSLNVWVAGSSTGEEVFSLAILLKEEGLYEKSVIFATDINLEALKTAQEGIYPIERLLEYEEAYQKSGGQKSLASYYTAAYNLGKMDATLTTNVVFSEHSLVTDAVFTECNLILCRNVLIYFNKPLQERALKLFDDSLRYGGFLALGSKENLQFSSYSKHYESLDPKWRLYKKRTEIGDRKAASFHE